MITNATTLILGAGASAPQYPTGERLRSLIISGEHATPYEKVLEKLQDTSFEKEDEKRRYDHMKERFRRSHIVSIDAFLAEPENQGLAKEGHIAIASALIPSESTTEFPPWYPDLFNAIRYRDETRTNKLTVVTFNYDLSLEFFLYHAFQNAYGLSKEETRKIYGEHIEIIHVYGDLGELAELSDSRSARQYGAKPPRIQTIIEASKRINTITRGAEVHTNFLRAFKALQGSSFIAILGYGFDSLNNANLRLQEAVADKTPFATGFGLGSGSRARLASLAHKTCMIMGGKRETVREFLEETDFLRWINEPDANAASVGTSIMSVFEQGRMPYTR